jgi:tRNA A-37 threonylcarbamoyl transferase component Bud32
MEVENPLLDFGTLLAQGAEGRIYQCTFLGRQTIVKERFVKSYRIAFLDSKINVGRISTGNLSWVIF